MKKTLLKFFTIILCSSTAIVATAQKLPAQQTVSLRAPAGLKIDGKATEWGNKFQAYNKKDKLFYTVFNDDKNLYLTVNVVDYLTINKISQGGITFTVSKILDKKQRTKTTDQPEVRFPYISLTATNNGSGMANRAREYYNLKKDSVANKLLLDSLVTESNSKLASVFKEIRVLGMKAITDTVISMYNTDGIKIGASFDKNMTYTYELAIPLKHLDLSTADGAPFSYNIKLKGTPTNEEWMAASKYPPPVIRAAPGSRAYDDYLYLSTPTDFWGEYTLAK